MSRSLSILLAVAVLAALAAVLAVRARTTAPSQPPGQGAGTGPEAVSAAAPPFRFRDGSLEAGLVEKVVYGGPPEHKIYGPETDGAGVALFDYDGDGWLDIYVLNGSTLPDVIAGSNYRGNFLYRNLGDRTFQETSVKAGLADTGWGKGVAVGDVDNDGDPDVHVSNMGVDAFYRNNGDGTFTDVSARAGISREFLWKAGCAFGDYNADSFLDLFVATYCYYDPYDPPVHGKHGADCRGVGYRIVNCGPAQHRPAPDFLYRNTGDGTFRNVYAEAGLGKVAPRHGQAVLFADIDDNGRTDILVAHDADPNHVLYNTDGEHFEERGAELGFAGDFRGNPQGCMGASYADLNADGLPEVLVTNHWPQYNTLYGNHGGRYSDDTHAYPALLNAIPYVGWGIVWEDLDCDGALDLVVADGHTDPFWVDPHEEGASGFAQRPLVYHGTSDGGFDAVWDPTGPLYRHLSARGMAAGDLDRDGDLDIVLWILDDAPLVFWNESPRGHFLLFRLEGVPPSNRDAYGARLTLEAGGRRQVRWCHSEGSYQSAAPAWVHFGLGSAVVADKLTLRWPSGRVESFTGLAADRFYTLREGAGVVGEEGPR